MDRNSIVNQRITGKFVEREVLSNVNTMVEYILSKSYEDTNAPFSWDNVENLYKDNSTEIEEKQEQMDEIQSSERYLELDGIYSNSDLNVEEESEYNKLAKEIDNLQNEIEQLESEQEDQQEVFEWWLVSDYLCRKLKERGEVVIEDENIWGRCTTGQSILLDGVISNICEEMEILQGQQHSWE